MSGSGRKGMEGIVSKSGGSSPVLLSQSLNVSSRNDTLPLATRSSGNSLRIFTRFAFRLRESPTATVVCVGRVDFSLQEKMTRKKKRMYVKLNFIRIEVVEDGELYNVNFFL
jgi:hypothetical protein